MSEPIYGVTTERIYRRLPEFYRNLDAQHNWQFKKYISSISDELNEIDRLIARLEYIPPEEQYDYKESLDEYNSYSRSIVQAYYVDLSKYPTYGDLSAAKINYSALTQITPEDEPAMGLPSISETSDLLDARTADPAWYQFIAQLTGADISNLSTIPDRRDALKYNYLGFRAGSREAIENAVKDVLTGTRFVRIYPHSDGASGSITSVGTQWDILIVTKTLETPSVQDIVNEVIRKGAKPAGVVLHHLSYSISWDSLESLLPTWNNIDQSGSWNNLELID